ncbi:transposase, partial [Bacillus sp. FJAT-47783]
TNNKIKLIKRRGYGYRNDKHLFLRIRLETGC